MQDAGPDPSVPEEPLRELVEETGGPAVQVVDVRKVYRAGDQALEILRGVDLEVGRGEFVSVMGPSGSGKSTLLNLVGLLDTPTSGSIALMGASTAGLGSNGRADLRRSTIGFVFQSFNLMPRLTALRNVMLPMAIAGVPRRDRVDKATALLGSVGLGDRVGHRPNELSGGQKQRVAIARALALDPPILLADEPTGNLDSTTSGEVMELFVRLNREGKTIVQVTHDERMAAFSSRVVRFHDGLIAEPPPAAVSPVPSDDPSFFLAPPKLGRAAKLRNRRSSTGDP